MYKLYGIPNCDTVKKARRFLEYHGVPVNFIDFKKNPPSDGDILRWKEAFQDFPVNTKGATYKKYKEEFEALDAKAKIQFLKQHTSMMKRPILEKDEVVLAFGFDEKSYQGLFHV